MRVQKVQKVQRVQRGRYRRFAADFEKGARLTAQVGAACGHACGVRVQRILRVLRFDSPSG